MYLSCCLSSCFSTTFDIYCLIHVFIHLIIIIIIAETCIIHGNYTTCGSNANNNHLQIGYYTHYYNYLYIRQMDNCSFCLLLNFIKRQSARYFIHPKVYMYQYTYIILFKQPEYHFCMKNRFTVIMLIIYRGPIV